MARLIKIRCHRCNRKIDAIVLRESYLDKNINRDKSDNPIYPAFRRLKITSHRRGLFKGKCSRSGKVFRVKGKLVTEDMPGYDHFDINSKDERRYIK